MKYFLVTLFFVCPFFVLSQIDSMMTTSDSAQFKPSTVVENRDLSERYPYILPIWGQKAVDRGFGDKLQLPFGLNVMYVNTSMDIQVTDFSLNIGDNEKVNSALEQIATVENLNFTSTTASANGVNFRADAWILPFLNVYGMGSVVTGGTQVNLQPTFYPADTVGNVVDTIKLPEFGSEVKFNATSVGFGGTLAYGYQNVFVSVDANYTWNSSALLDQSIGMFTGSGRVGRVFNFRNKNKSRLAFYVGFMYRNFGDVGPSKGGIKLSEALPGLKDNVNAGLDGRFADNQVRLDELNDKPRLTPGEKVEKGVLEVKQEANRRMYESLNKDEQGYDTDIRYQIKKDLLYPWTFEFGFNYEINKRWTFRGEYGISQHQRLLLTGVSWRFGIRKSNKTKNDGAWFSGGHGWN